VSIPRCGLILMLCLVAVFSRPLSSVNAGEEWQPISADDLKMTSEPKAPGAPAVYLYRQVDRNDSGKAGSEFNYVRIKILTEEGRKYGNVEIPFEKGRYDCEPRVEVRSLTTDWKTVATINGKNRPYPGFVNDEELVLAGSPRKLIRTSGEVVFEDRSYEGCWWGVSTPSAGGRRFAVPACTFTGAVPTLDIGGFDVLRKILLYDAPFHGLSYALDVQGPKIKDRALLALSPDGGRLAILEGESLEVFELPALPE
jgi:hypothetical protein